MSEEILVNDSLVVRSGACGEFRGPQENLPEFTTVRGWEGEYDEDGTVLISKFAIKSDWPVYLVIRVDSWHEATGELDDPEWCVSLRAVSPLAAGARVLKSAMECVGTYPEDIQGYEYGQQQFMKVEALSDYGAYAPIAEFNSDDANAAVLAAKSEALVAQMMFGFYMDRRVNAMGSTGWDFIKGKV